MGLTKAVIDRAKYEGVGNNRQVIWDSNPTGLGLRIYPSGKKSFILSYRVAKNKKLLTLGDYGVLTLHQARDMARKRLALVIDGIDPLAEKRRHTQGETVGALAAAYIDRHAKPRKRSWLEDDRRLKTRILPLWKNRLARSITRAEVAAIHHDIGIRTKYEANRILALLSKMFELGRQWGLLDERQVNPAKGIEKFRESKRDRWIKPQELPRLAIAIEKEPNIYVRGAFWLYLFTGVRKSELLTARWDDVDFHRKELRLPKTKSGGVHYVHLSKPALQCLERLPRQLGNPFILPGNRSGRPLVNINKPWARIRYAAQIDDVRLHDLRRTVGSWLAQSGHSLPLIGKVLNHTNTSTTQIYARLGEDLSRIALDKHGEEIEKAAR